MQNSHYLQLPWTLNVVDADDLEPVHRPGPLSMNRAATQRPDARMLFDPIQTLPHGFAKAERCRRIVHVYQVVSELPDNVALGTPKEFRRLSTRLPPAVLGGHQAGP